MSNPVLPGSTGADGISALPPSSARQVYVYEVWPSKDDGRGTSGWSVHVVTERHDLSDLLRITQVRLADMWDDDAAAQWTGIKKAELLTVATLDPRLA